MQPVPAARRRRAAPRPDAIARALVTVALLAAITVALAAIFTHLPR